MTTSNTLKLYCEPCNEYQSFTRRIEENGLYVSDIPHGVTERELYRLFRQYGQIADFYMADRAAYCLVHFLERFPVYELTSYPVRLFGQELRIRPRFQSKADEERRAALNEIHGYHEEVLKSVSSNKGFKEQIDDFIKTVEADESAVQKRNQVCNDLENVLKYISPFCKIIPFGSSVNGLAFKNSDLDLFYGIDVTSSDPNVSDVFRKVRVALEKLKLLESFKPIPNARVPIIKFVHKATRYSCDLSFRDIMGVQNSRLIKFLISLDKRIKPFFMIVKYWAKLHNLTGKRMSNYALILVLINFLQSLNDPILPPLKDLQHSGVEHKLVSGWNVNFDNDPSRLRPISNDLPVEELLIRFFECFGKTDFTNYVVCPFAGSLVSRNAFSSQTRLPDELSYYTNRVLSGKQPLQVDSDLCVQDPIELNLNVSKNVAKHDFECFKQHCYMAAQLSYNFPPHMFLSKLLSVSCSYPPHEKEKSWFPNPMHSRPIKPYLTMHVPYPKNMTDEILWVSDLIQNITVIFKKVLKISVENERKGHEMKPGSDHNVICKGSQVLWVNRDKLWNQWHSKNIDSPATNVTQSNEKEVEVLEICEDGPSTSTTTRGQKRKRVENYEIDSKRRKIEDDNNERSNVDLIVLDPEERTMEASALRSLQDEINLTNEMVRKGHALPASAPILDFYCRICRNNGCNVRIEISDRRSRNDYFSSLCLLLEDFLNKYAFPS